VNEEPPAAGDGLAKRPTAPRSGGPAGHATYAGRFEVKVKHPRRDRPWVAAGRRLRSEPAVPAASGSDQREELVHVHGRQPRRASDGVAGVLQAVQADAQVAQAGHDAGARASTHATTVLVEGGVADEKDAILDGPLAAYQVQQFGLIDLFVAEAGNAEDLFLLAMAVAVLALPLQPEDQLHVGE
jgi:hypothetical protein